jgi:cytochrome c biogenesis protein CcmG, thiol:disulfide interchange protein DsbE
VYEGSPGPDYDEKLAGSPAPLAALHDQANELLPGGQKAFEARLAELEGFPVVANVWASWCGPCREEFPHFQQVSADLGTEVAFMGIDSQDSSSAAATFLESNPVPYPSFSDPDEEITRSVGAGQGLPATAFFDASGERTHTKIGPYRDEEELEADVRRYALGTG